MQTDVLRIGTRGSPLALAQANETRNRLMAAHGMPEEAIEIEVISTAGDRIQNRPLSEVGGKGLFTKEIEEALLDGRIDIAVHSAKDMPTVLPDGLELSCYLEREDVRDAFIGRASNTLQELPHAATVGSSSLRRQALIRKLRPDLKVEQFRGNVQTRLKKLEDGVADATLLANAGLTRLGMTKIITELLDTDRFPPAPGQGAICIEQRSGNDRVSDLLEAINHPATATALDCERAFLAALDGSCRTPIAGLARLDGEELAFNGMILTPDGQTSHLVSGGGRIADAAGIGQTAGEKVRSEAGTTFFDSWS